MGATGKLTPVLERVRLHAPPPVEPPERVTDLALLAAAVGDVPLRFVTTTRPDPDRDGGRDGGEREDQDDSRTLDGRAYEPPRPSPLPPGARTVAQHMFGLATVVARDGDDEEDVYTEDEDGNGSGGWDPEDGSNGGPT